MTSKRPVLIVGAGPVGLTAAAFLARFGTPVRIIDINATPTLLSKALILWRRSIMTLDPLVPHQHWATVGRAGKGVYIGDEGAVVRHIDLSNPSGTPDVSSGRDGKVHELPAGYFVTQAYTEAALVSVLQQKFGISVQRNTKLASFKVAGDGQFVSCVLESSGPGDQLQQEQVEVSHLVACDGGRSTVRKQLGLTFKGATLKQRWWLADAKFEVQDGINPHTPQHEVERVPLRDELQFFTTSVGSIGLLPIAGREGHVRIMWNVGSLGPTKVTLDDFQQLILDHTRLQIKLTEAIWVNEFKINERQIENYVQAGGRVLFAGDAAHVHSPAGGQGMNTGIQDAANLAWKLALVVAGEAAAGAELLETYHEERWPIGAMVIRNSGLILRGNSGPILRSYFVRMVRLLALHVLTSLPMVRQMLATTLAEDSIAYPSSSLASSGLLSSINISAAASVPDKTASAAAQAVWGICKPGYGFPDVTVVIDGESKPAIELLRSAPGSFGTLVVLMPSDGITGLQQRNGLEAVKWPANWGHWQLNVVQVADQLSAGAGGGVSDGLVVDSWGLLRAAVGGWGGEVGVLVRPDGIVAAVGGAEVIDEWLKKHLSTTPAATD